MLDLPHEFSFGRHGLFDFHRAAMLAGAKICRWRNRVLYGCRNERSFYGMIQI
jgi:hypothetical protein